MSNYWQYKCSCGDEYRPENSNHKSVEMGRLLYVSDQLVTAGAAINNLLASKEARYDLESTEGYNVFSGTSMFRWFSDHFQHGGVKLFDEYGHEFTKCPKWAICPCCKSQKPCVLDNNHVEDCRP